MKQPLFITLTATFLLAGGAAQSQDRIYRCGNEYTNHVPAGQRANCKLLEGGNVTVVQRQRVPASIRLASASETPTRVNESSQRARDMEARQILENELRRAESRQAELLREYNNGEPEKLGPETRNHQKYLDRVADLKSSMDRNESDIAGLRRELGRYPESK